MLRLSRVLRRLNLVGLNGLTLTYGEKRLKAIGSKVNKANKGLEARPSTNRY